MTNIRDYLKYRNGQAEEEYQKKISKHRRKIRITITIIFLMLAVTAIGVKIYFDNRSYSEYEVTYTRSMNGAGDNKYFRVGESMLIYTDD